MLVLMVWDLLGKSGRLHERRGTYNKLLELVTATLRGVGLWCFMNFDPEAIRAGAHMGRQPGQN